MGSEHNENVLRRLLPRHYRILDLHREGHSVRDIAHMLGMSTVGVRYVVSRIPRVV